MYLYTVFFPLSLQAVECQLIGLGPEEIDWTDAALNRFEDLVDPNTAARATLEVNWDLY